MSQLYALPGFMPTERPKFEAIIDIPWNSELNVLLYSEPSSEPEKPVFWYMEVQGYGQKLHLQKNGESVFPNINGENREYRLKLPGKSLPPGTHRLEYSIGSYDGMGAITGNRNITIKRTLGSSHQPSVLLQEIPSTPPKEIDGVEYIVLYNPDTATYYKLSLTGFLDQAQITLQEMP